jgi:uncharacterized membrane protein YraQ (UPF0718 family)
MGGDMALEDPLGFEAAFTLESTFSLIQTIFYTTLNWVSTNQKGMFFGLLLAAGLMTLFSLVQRREFKGYMSNTLFGVVLGAPLGVCVNCAAPIAKALHTKGMRNETTLATMLSSPTLNVIVLSMLFTLFPFYIALTKIAFTLLLILIVVPLFVRYVLPNPSATALSDNNTIDCPVPTKVNSKITSSPYLNISWFAATTWFVGTYFKKLRFIVIKTVPLMLLAGLLGATLITLVPWETVVTFLKPSGYFSLVAAM